ncbi:hypothetical protein HPC38_05035 [Pasteurellaceae bacterium HPA106]|uniref:hypothetical protein n=1 Tax=Spirabiliibacterium pneumoniae TaxID=221400 RepID=UPI001AAD65C2|nr:hypothetical protein [Spirabiliibacterium pneumoniae]MBE2896238.1 hypothetical protein [Spirabiliibacterium pneumoniae]
MSDNRVQALPRFNGRSTTINASAKVKDIPRLAQYAKDGAQIKNKLAKLNLLGEAISHYLSGKPLLKIVTLDCDDEPYPLADVITLQGEYIERLQRRYELSPTNENRNVLALARRRLRALELLNKKHRQ